MFCVHYKFFSKLDHNMVLFNSQHIMMRDLKRQIMSQEKINETISDLQISNAQTNEEYTDDALIPKNSSVIIRRIPAKGVKSSKRRFLQAKSLSAFKSSLKTHLSPWLLNLSEMLITNLAEVNASKEDKIKDMMFQSSQYYSQPQHMDKLAEQPPPNYVCFRCGITGHYIRNCPTIGIKKSSGIPSSFMREVSDTSVKGAMLTNTGAYAIPIINAESYAIKKKEKHPFFSQEQSSSSSEEEDPVPDELLCPICKDFINYAAVTPCCGNSYCDECEF
uniref:RBBP6 n=1 Tax=Denticeps clupeoides TaxID=299321 RepID=A0AAY4CVD6_9TELE